jgi:hypothetical protein
MTKNSRIDSPKVLNEDRNLRPPEWKLFCAEERDFIKTACFRDTIHPVAVVDQKRVRQMDRLRDRWLWAREPSWRVIERPYVAICLAISEILAENVQPAVVDDSEWVAKKVLAAT